MSLRKPLPMFFYRTANGKEPVKEWLSQLSKADRRRCGEELRVVQWGWPLGMPLVKKIEMGLWEVRVRLDQRIARILFTLSEGNMIVLHAFIKKSQKINQDDLHLARQRKRSLS